MTVQQTTASLACLVTVAAAAAGAQQLFLPAACDIKPNNDLVDKGMQALRSAYGTKFQDQRTKDLKDAERLLTQAVTTGKQEKNPAAWYYLGRYYLMQGDFLGADSALIKALALAPKCENDIALYRRNAWVPVFNAGVSAWQAGNTDSAIAYFRHANQVYRDEPMGFVYIANLFAQANDADSAVKYFRLAVPAAADPKYAQDKRDALFNVARLYHSMRRYPESEAAYKDYLATYPSDVQAIASLAGVYALAGHRDSAMTLYQTVLDRADSASANDLFAAAETIVAGIPDQPDTSTLATKCRAEQRKKRPIVPAREILARCTKPAVDTMARFHAAADSQYRLAARAYRAGLAKNPYYRQGLYNLGGISYVLGDSSNVLPLAQRLDSLDPMNRNTLAVMARAWQMFGKRDSVMHYLNLADSLPVEVTVSDFHTTSKGATLQGLLTNFHTTASAPLTVTFEFLNAQGRVVRTAPEQVPALDAGANQPFTLKADTATIVAWRYRSP